MNDFDLYGTLARSPLFRGAPNGVIASVGASCESRLLGTRDRLLAAGETNQRLYVVLAGSVNVHLPDDGPPVTLGPGECVGELSILDGRPATADVVAAESTVVLSLDREQIWSLIDSSADIARNLLRMLAKRVRSDDSRLAESSRLQRYFERMATVDGLTGLRNRRWLDESFPRQLDRSMRSGEAVSVLMADVDHFKELNDKHGHLVGDAMLCRLARVLAEALRPQDLLARYGGEEFAVLLPGLDGTAATHVADRLRAAVEADRAEPADALLPSMTISIGVATVRGKESIVDLLKRADAALYRAKEGGRNRVSQ